MKEHNFLPGKIDKCQICGSNNLINVINLGEQPLANSLLSNIKEEKKNSKISNKYYSM